MSVQGITMAGKGFDGMRKSELKALEDAKLQARKVRALNAKCDEIAPNGRYRSPMLTGMPGGRGEPCGLDGSKSECEKLLEERDREKRKLDQMIRKCEKSMEKSGMKAELKEFCRNYFFGDMSVENAIDRMGMSAATGWNYKAEIYAKKRRKTRKKQGESRKNGTR